MASDNTARESEELRRQAEKMEAVGMLARGIAHDFNNILSGVLGFTSYLKSKAEPGSDLHRDLSLIEQAGIHGAELTKKLFLMARRRHGMHERVLMNEIVSDAVTELRGQMPANVIIETGFPQALPPVLGDPAQFSVAVRTLLLRAVSAMPANGGKISVNIEGRPLTQNEEELLVNTAAAAYVCMTVSDTGRAMSPETRTRIFDPFYLARTSREGPGLDMPIVYGVVANHLGNIVVESSDGQGSTFRLYLPVAAETTGTAIADEDLLAGRETVLVVDDEKMVRDIIVWILEAKGYKVLTASSGEEALQIHHAEGAHLDLVLLDIMMPGMGGEETFHALRAADPDVRVLLTSINVHEALCECLVRQGACGMVFKPYKSNVLLKAVRKALGSPQTP